MLNPFINLAANIIDLYCFVLIVYIVMNWLIAFNIINRTQPVVAKVYDVLSRLSEPALRPIQRYMPDLGGVDISPIILILLLKFLKNVLYSYFYGI